MARVIPPINPLTFTFNEVVDTVNAIIGSLATEVLTVDATPDGATTTGNGFVYGQFGSNTMIVTTALRGGNSAVSDTLYVTSDISMGGTTKLSVGSATTNVSINSTSISIANSTSGIVIRKPSASQVSSGGYFLNANGSYTEVDSQTVVATSGITTQQVDSFLKANHRAGEYAIAIKDNDSTSYQMSKVMVVHDGTDAYQNEFGVLTTSITLGSFSANANATHVRLYFTPAVVDATVTLKRSLLNT